MVEIKAEKDINDTEVQEKAEAGKKYCEAATTFNVANGDKKWTYVLTFFAYSRSGEYEFEGTCVLKNMISIKINYENFFRNFQNHPYG